MTHKLWDLQLHFFFLPLSYFFQF